MSNSSEELNQVDYSFPKWHKSKWALSSLGVFFLAFLLYYPISYTIKNLIIKQANQIPGCPLAIKDIQFELFLPKIVLRDTKVPKRCHPLLEKDLLVKRTSLNFRGFTFSPFGPHFKLETRLLNNKLNALVTTGLGEILVNLNDNNLSLENLSKGLKNVNLSGLLKLNASLSLESQKLSSLKLNLRSDDIHVLPQSISGFKLSRLNLNKLFVKAQMEKGKDLKLNNLIIGDVNSPIRANFKGKLKLNQKRINSSSADITGEVAFSDDFIAKYSLIQIMMSRFDKKNNFYQLSIKGPLSAPSIKSPKK